tara:strand:+ start:670 stop:1407 length:738 start_codon:yes stop_codon:yes gene_type:complete
MNSISANLNIMIKAADKASKILIRDFGEIEKLQVSKKGPNDFVTNADLKAEKMIIDELTRARPNYSILSEETGLNHNNDKDRIWIIDPIDGTTNFLHGIPHFAISIALQLKSEIVSGLIFDPIKNEMFYAEKNSGSFLNNQRIKVSKKNNINDCLFATDRRLSKEIDLIYRKSGSAALDMAYLAAGRFDGYFQKNLNLWDVAAGLILIKEAGGVINNIDIHNHNDLDIIASTSQINKTLIEKLKI